MPAESEIALEEVERLYRRYERPGPRYTSYPTVPVWSDTFGRRDHQQALSELDPTRERSLYAHVPFCRSLCHFCACNRVITQDPERPNRFLDAIEHELRTTLDLLIAPPRIGQLHWGGGTPTHLTPHQLERLFYAIDARVDLLPDAERSIEVDPRVTTRDHVDTLAGLGFDRISLGVQDTNPRTQAAIRRIQPFEQTLALTEQSRAAGIAGVNYDLVYGLPHQTLRSMRRTLDDVLIARPDRIALYGYAHVTWVAKQQRGFERGDLPNARRRLELLLESSQRLLEAGYRWIGIDHFALPDDPLARALDDGSLRRNFMGYTTRAGTEILAFGPSAISELESGYVQADKTLGGWTDSALCGRLATSRGHTFTKEDRARRFVIERIMCVGHVAKDEVLARFGETFAEHYDRDLQRLTRLEDDGLVTITESRDLCVEPIGRLFLRNVAMAFDAYLPRDGVDPYPKRPVFSQTI